MITSRNNVLINELLLTKKCLCSFFFPEHGNKSVHNYFILLNESVSLFLKMCVFSRNQLGRGAERHKQGRLLSFTVRTYTNEK